MSGWTQEMVTKRELTAADQARKNRHAVAGRRADLGNQHFRSKMEANIARYLNWMQGLGAVLKWEYETETFRFNADSAAEANFYYQLMKQNRRLLGVTRGVTSYKIDFKVWYAKTPDDPEYIECKGFMDSKSKTKLRRLELYFPWVKIRVLDSAEYKAIAQQCKGVISTWE